MGELDVILVSSDIDLTSQRNVLRQAIKSIPENGAKKEYYLGAEKMNAMKTVLQILQNRSFQSLLYIQHDHHRNHRSQTYHTTAVVSVNKEWKQCSRELKRVYH